MKRFALFVAGLALASGLAGARAEIPLNGYVIARAECPAVQSIRKGTNPGNVTTTLDRAYTLFAKNKAAASHYLILVEGATPERRWIAVSCGEHVVPADGSMVVVDGGGDTPDGGADGGGDTQAGTAFVLAASWQPAFCETRPAKPECESQTGERFDASHFALHGLWPQPRGNDYCGVSAADKAADKAGRWGDLPALELAEETRAELDRVMPGTQSFLQRHEFTKHGSCYPGASAEEYFRASLLLMEQLNASAVQELFASSVGGELDAGDIKAAFETAFGPGAGDRVRISCASDGGRRIITELQISLRGAITDETVIEDLFAGAATASTGCSGGVVDAVGLQ